MDTVKHVVHKERESVVPTFEWKFEEHIGVHTHKPQGYTFSYRMRNVDNSWKILVDASMSGGKVVIYAERLRKDGVEVKISGQR